MDKNERYSLPRQLAANQVYQDWPLYYDPLRAGERKPDDPRFPQESGMAVQENGDVLFWLWAPGASEVFVTIEGRKQELKKNADGVFEGVMEYVPGFAGPHSFDFHVDGACLLSPYAPISWHRNRPVNYVDIPDPDTEYIGIADIPHGAVTREIFWSSAMGRWERCLVYTPAGYMNGNESYPVLYLQHGATENEVTWEYNGRVSSIMDRLIAEGKAKPCIVVMNNGMLSRTGAYGEAFQDVLLGDCIPYIEKTYRVKTDKWSRAMAGLSMGSIQTSVIGLTHPELFGYLGLFSGFMRNLMTRESGNVHLEALKDTKAFEEAYRVFFRSIGEKDHFFERFDEDDRICAEAGIDKLPGYTRIVYKDQTHEFGAWRRALYDFAQRIF